jgi:alkanesulfonate monooxygenase SsuD/methylene tetrahydromethanopterin reductase-like flavin-dependent oxidoreductase (luciferase family)
MRCGLFLPNFGPFADPNAMVSLAVEAEENGWDGFFIWDHLQWDDDQPVADPWVVLSAVAASTSTLRFGTALTPLARRRPWKLARETVTLDHLSGGRLILGVGLGYAPEFERGSFPEEPDARVRAQKLDQALEILAGLWSGEPFEFSGSHFQVSRTRFLPKPVQSPRIPVWVGGWWPNKRPYERAARWDGVLTELVGGGTPSVGQIKDMIAFVAERRENGSPFDVVVNGVSDRDYHRGDEGHPSLVEEYADAGVTWWLERFEPDDRFTVEQVRERILKGPPAGRTKTTSNGGAA